MEGLKVITAAEMARIEKRSIDEGASDRAYMDQAGRAIAQAVHDFITQHHLKPKVTLLVGKGNNGGDAFVCGNLLLEKRYEVQAITLFDKNEVSPLSKEHGETFVKLGGKLTHDLPTEGVLVDGLLGTGFKGAVKEPIAGLIERANASGLPILSIDIPSGLSGDDGASNHPIISATMTLYLGLPKMGFFLNNGMDYTGTLYGCDFGLAQKYIDDAHAKAFLVNEEILPSLLPPIKPTRHKYEAGYVLAIAGSPGMPGAALMACQAAYRTGAGIIRLFHPSGMENELGTHPEELVRSVWDLDLFFKEQKRASAILIGPGIGKDRDLKDLWPKLDRPTVIDADGLHALSKAPNHVFATPTILTPHKQEMLALLDEKPADLLEATQTFADKINATIVLKGAPTFIIHPKKPILIMHRGTPGLAKAGTGDVLTGMIAALLAGGLGTREAAGLGAWLHALAGERVTLDKTAYGLIATDLIEMIPEILSEIT